jgi:predicted Zn-dependent protease with MMP-like domain/Flp pilus assembly protein TadD
MSLRRSEIVLAALSLSCQSWGQGLGQGTGGHATAPRVHWAQPAARPESPPSMADGPELLRPQCPKDQDRLDAAAQAYDAQRYDLSLACAEDELLEEPESPEAEQQRGLALAALGKPEEARLAFAHALALDPDDPEILADAADLYLTHGNVTRELDEIALEYARRGERRARRRRPELLEQLEMLQGMALNDLGRSQEALPKLGDALSDDPNDLDARYEHAVALFELCRFPEAKADLKQVLAALPQDAYAHQELGLTLERMGNGREARAELDRATALDPAAFPAPLPVEMDEFKRMVDAAVQALPPRLHRDLDQVKLSVEEMPDLTDLTVDEPPLSPTILGLFRGEPLGEPGEEPRAILLYRRNLVRMARSREELAKQVQVTLWHELGHLRGADDDELRLRGLE